MLIDLERDELEFIGEGLSIERDRCDCRKGCSDCERARAIEKKIAARIARDTPAGD